DEELAHLRRGVYAPQGRAAALLLDRVTEEKQTHPIPSHISRPLSVLLVVEPSAAGGPHPRVSEGRLLDPHFTLTAADRAALETALRLRDAGGAGVAIHVAAVGPRGVGQVLREVQGLDVDGIRLLVTEAEAISLDATTNALAAVLGHGP